jgi:integrase/recombinase XerD
MYDDPKVSNFSRRRHQDLPLRAERERFLSHLAAIGSTYKTRRCIATVLLRVVEYLRLQEPRRVSRSEIDKAARRWATRRRRNDGRRKPTRYSLHFFIYTARKWLRFTGLLDEPAPRAAHQPFASYLEGFVRFMREERALSEDTIRSHRWKTSKFLQWFATGGRSLRRVRLQDVDAFITKMAQGGRWCRISQRIACHALRAFFRYGERQGWCRGGFADAIEGPRRYAMEGLPSVLSWDEVDRLVAACSGNSRSALRARAVVLLACTYGLRACEIVALRMDDVDWNAETLRIHRGKLGKIQVFPLSRQVGTALLAYLRGARLRTDLPLLFTSIFAPARPMVRTSVHMAVSTRMDRIGLTPAKRGTHTLRHACATRLLSRGVPLKAIADHLGHQSPDCTRIYAKVDLASLREVADVRLEMLL